MKRPLLIFAGQSNMMGAAVYDAPRQIVFARSFEYLHKPRRFGLAEGRFKSYGFPTGEFSYGDLALAYGEGGEPSAESTLCDYAKHTLFCPSMSNLADEREKLCTPLCEYSEQSAHKMATSLAPYIVEGLEAAGFGCAYTHIAKGGVRIRHYLDGESARYFDEKVRDFFSEAERRFAADDTSERVLIFHQGESDAATPYEEYKKSLHDFYARVRTLGVTKMLIVRVGYWGQREIAEIMRAQEDFVHEAEGAYMLTRVASYFPFPNQELDGWMEDAPDEYLFCRDSFFGFSNNHINDKGFRVIAAQAVPNLVRLLFLGEECVLEEERILPLKKGMKI